MILASKLMCVWYEINNFNTLLPSVYKPKVCGHHGILEIFQYFQEIFIVKNIKISFFYMGKKGNNLTYYFNYDTHKSSCVPKQWNP